MEWSCVSEQWTGYRTVINSHSRIDQRSCATSSCRFAMQSAHLFRATASFSLFHRQHVKTKNLWRLNCPQDWSMKLHTHVSIVQLNTINLSTNSYLIREPTLVIVDCLWIEFYSRMDSISCVGLVHGHRTGWGRESSSIPSLSYLHHFPFPLTPSRISFSNGTGTGWRRSASIVS